MGDNVNAALAQAAEALAQWWYCQRSVVQVIEIAEGIAREREIPFTPVHWSPMLGVGRIIDPDILAIIQGAKRINKIETRGIDL